MTSDPGRSRAVLFGVHDFRDLPRLDGVRHNAPALRELLTSDEIGGLADEDCTVVPHDGTQQQLLDALHDAAQEATDLLLVYYAGHGHFGGRDRQFLLATGNSSGQRPYHSVKYSDIRDLVAGSAAQRKVVVIDCCFSGRALSMADEQTPTQLDTEITGACVLTSAAETERSLCLPDGSVFTLELTKLLSEGLSGELTGGRQGEHLPELTMTDVFNALHTRLHGRTVDGLRVPQPRMSTRDLGHQIVLARNRAYTGPPTDGPESASEEHPWVAATRDHPLWNYVTDERGLLSLRETATALVARAAAASEDDGEALGGDPWHSPAFTDRVAEWTDSLLLDSSLRPDELELSAAEVFLLVTHPYLHAAFWRQNASRYASISPTVLAEAQSTAPARRSYDLFLRNHPRLVRRALRSSDPRAAEAIGWWLFHRWLVLEPRLYDPAAAETLLDRLAVPLGERSPGNAGSSRTSSIPAWSPGCCAHPSSPDRPSGTTGCRAAWEWRRPPSASGRTSSRNSCASPTSSRSTRSPCRRCWWTTWASVTPSISRNCTARWTGCGGKRTDGPEYWAPCATISPWNSACGSTPAPSTPCWPGSTSAAATENGPPCCATSPCTPPPSR